MTNEAINFGEEVLKQALAELEAAFGVELALVDGEAGAKLLKVYVEGSKQHLELDQVRGVVSAAAVVADHMGASR